jgi:hypothetical protein
VSAGRQPVRLPHMEAAMTAEGRQTYHVEDGRLPCWCDMDRDHTTAEFWAFLDTATGEATDDAAGGAR